MLFSFWIKVFLFLSKSGDMIMIILIIWTFRTKSICITDICHLAVQHSIIFRIWMIIMISLFSAISNDVFQFDHCIYWPTLSSRYTLYIVLLSCLMWIDIKKYHRFQFCSILTNLIIPDNDHNVSSIYYITYRSISNWRQSTEEMSSKLPLKTKST